MAAGDKSYFFHLTKITGSAPANLYLVCTVNPDTTPVDRLLPLALVPGGGGGGGDMDNPMTAVGDIIYGSVAGTPATPARLAIGSTGQILMVVDGVPAWADAPSGVGSVLYLYDTRPGLG